MRVIVVEDDQDMIELLILLLREMAGWTVDGYTDPTPLLDQPQRLSEADLLLVDLNMRPVSGPELLARIRDTAPLSCPVVFLTGQQPSPEEQGLADGVILKPFTYPELMTRLKRLLGDRFPG